MENFTTGANAKTTDLAPILHANRRFMTVTLPPKVSACWDILRPVLRTDYNNPMPLILGAWPLFETDHGIGVQIASLAPRASRDSSGLLATQTKNARVARYTPTRHHGFVETLRLM
jgi:hypothetical protein